MLRDWSDLPSDRIRRATVALFEDHARLSDRLVEIESELRQLMEPRHDHRVVALPEVCSLLLEHRKRRNRLYPGLFGEPAWDILLSLGSLQPNAPDLPVSSVSFEADVPLATAVRQLALLETTGWVERAAHPSDRRIALIRLTPEGRERLQRMVEKWPLAVMVVAAPLTIFLAKLLW